MSNFGIIALVLGRAAGGFDDVLQRLAVQDVEAGALAADQAAGIELAERAGDHFAGGAGLAGQIAQGRKRLDRPEVGRKREEPSVRTSRVIPADRAAAEFSKALLLDVTSDTPVEALIAVLRDNRGECPVYLSVPAPDGLVAQIQCHRSLSVTCTPSLLVELAAIIGRDAICLLGPKKRAIPFSVEETRIPSRLAAT